MEKVNKGGAVFDLQKLDWMNAHYLRSKPKEELIEMLERELINKNIEFPDKEYLGHIIDMFIERVNFIGEIPEYADYMFSEPKEYEDKFLRKQWKDNSLEIIQPFIELLKKTEDFTHNALYELAKDYCEKKGIKLKIVAQLLRLMITGKAAGAGMFETMEVLGKEKCLNRIDKFLNLYN